MLLVIREETGEKMAGLFKRDQKKQFDTEAVTPSAVAPVTITLEPTQSYVDLVTQELGGDVAAARAELDELTEKFNKVTETLDCQGHIPHDDKPQAYKRKSNRPPWSRKAEEIFAPMRRKSEMLKEKLECAERRLQADAYRLFYLGEMLDNLTYIRQRERIYNCAAVKIKELQPIMDEFNRHHFDVDYSHGFNTGLSGIWGAFIRVFENQKPGRTDEEALKVQFFEELERVKLQRQKSKEVAQLSELTL